MNGFLKWVVYAVSIYAAYKYRYKIINGILGNNVLRQTAVKLAMGIPGVKKKMIQSTFR